MTATDDAASNGALSPAGAEDEPAGRRGRGRFVSSLATRALISPEISLVIAIVVLGAIIQAKNPVFLKYDNLILVLTAAAPTFVMAVTMTFVLISGGIDLSVGSMSALGGVVAASALTSGFPIPVAILLGLLVGAGIGAVVGLLISWARIPALIVTLGALYIIRGIDLVITGGAQIYPLPADYNFLGLGSFFSVPFLVIYAVVVGVAAHVLLENSKYGFHLRAVGGNVSAARAAGINVRRVTMSGIRPGSGDRGDLGCDRRWLEPLWSYRVDHRYCPRGDPHRDHFERSPAHADLVLLAVRRARGRGHRGRGGRFGSPAARVATEIHVATQRRDDSAPPTGMTRAGRAARGPR